MRARPAWLGLAGLLAACAGGDNGGEQPATSTAGSSSTAVGSEGSGRGEASGDSDGGSSSSGGEVEDTSGGCPTQTYYPDADRDGYGDINYPVEACLQPPAHIPQGGDCDDANPEIYPGVEELCDGSDNDCNGLVDEASAMNTECEGCTLGLREDHAYYYCPQALSWDEARAFCMQWAADLVILDDQAEQDFLLAEPLPGAASYFVGLGDAAVEGTFVWVDGSAPSFTAWGKGEPNDAVDGEDCAELVVGTGTWNDIACAAPGRPFICEAPVP